MSKLYNKAFLRNISTAFLAQGISLLVSCGTNLVLPNVLGASEYSFWLLFMFYSSFTSVFQFGLHDGIYLIKGGDSWEAIVKSEVSSINYINIIAQFIFAIALMMVAFCIDSEQNRIFALIGCAIYIPLYNITRYFGYSFVAANLTKWHSQSIIIDRSVFLLLLSIFIAIGIDTFIPYMCIYLISYISSNMYVMVRGRELFGRFYIDKKLLKSAFSYMKVGIILLAVTFVSSFVLGAARFMIDFKWGIEQFGVVSFALTLINFFMLFINQASMVLFPALRQINHSHMKNEFIRLRDAVHAIVPFSYVCYYPIAAFLLWWLPDYTESIRYMVVLLPICVFESRNSLLGNTFLKVLRREKTMLAINIGTMLFSAVFSSISVFILSSIELTLIGMVLSVVLRSVISEWIISQALNCKFEILKEFVVIAYTISFIYVSSYLNDIYSFLITFLLYFLILACYPTFRKDVGRVIRRITHGNKTEGDIVE